MSLILLINLQIEKIIIKKGKKLKIVPIKVILTGDGAVGKTTLRRRFMGQTTSVEYLPTLGAEISIKNFDLTYNGIKYSIKIQIWDIAGQDIFNNVRSKFYNETNGIFLIYDITNLNSFDSIDDWFMDISKYLELENKPVVLIGNKIDLRPNNKDHITKEDGVLLARKLEEKYLHKNRNVLFIETSALTGVNVSRTFQEVARLLIKFEEEQNP